MITPVNDRIETDALGDRAIPSTALYGANTVRGVENFRFKGVSFGEVATFVRAFAAIKKASVLTNIDLGTIDRERGEANLVNSFAMATILVPDLGYAAVSKLVKESIAAKRPFLDLAEERGLIFKADALEAIKTAARGNS